MVTDLYLSWPDAPEDAEQVSAEVKGALESQPALAGGRRVTVTVSQGSERVQQFTFRPSGTGLAEELVIRGMHPLTGQRLDLWRLKNFTGTRMPAPEGIYVFHLVAPNNPADERLVALAEVRDVTPQRDAEGNVTGFPVAERVLASCLESIRRAQASGKSSQRLDNNRVFLHVWPTIEVPLADLAGFAQMSTPLTLGTGLEGDHGAGQAPGGAGQAVAGRGHQVRLPGRGRGVGHRVRPAHRTAGAAGRLHPEGAAFRGPRHASYPYELVPLLTGADGSFTEYDFDEAGNFVPVDRAPGLNTAGVVAGLVSTPTVKYPEGITRVALFGDPTKALGTVAVRECAIVVAAIDLAEEKGIPVEWFTLSSGAKISMDSGTENMDGVARALRRLITFTQGGGEVNIIVAGINVGAQPYWNAEATMLQHTRGILIMTPDSAMVLTGKMSLDYSGGVSAEDNFGIGGYDRVMGPNGEAQYWAPNLSAACDILFAHYDHAYARRGSGSRGGPRRPTRWIATSAASRTCTRTARSPRSATSSPRRPTRTARSRSTSAR